MHLRTRTFLLQKIDPAVNKQYIILIVFLVFETTSDNTTKNIYRQNSIIILLSLH